MIFIIFLLLIFLLIALYFLIKSNQKYKNLYSEVEREYKPIIDINEEIKRKKEEFKKEEDEFAKKIKEKEFEKSKKENEINELQKKNAFEKERALKILEKIKELNEETKLLEEKQELQEFSFYEPKYFYDSSEKYKEELDKINSAMKDMINRKIAATCSIQWTVGNSRRKGEKMTNDNLKLMLRAFNGEADAAIAKVKFNNVLVMEKRIKKAFEIINKLNEVNCCTISNKYLNLKLDELYLNYEMSKKIEEEKEEQRMIREQIKEEEKAQKEFEKAQLEAQKEEERARKALEKAEQKLKEVHGLELEKLNDKIELLKKQLEEAEQNKERAKSMAQQTKSGYVYVISNIGSFGENVYKIGMTRRLEPLDRVRELGDASVPFFFDVHAMIYSKNAPELEKNLHKEFYNNRVNKINDKREFFKVDLSEIEKVAKKYGANVEFTKIAKAEQYRETLAIEENMRKQFLKEDKKIDEFQEVKNDISNL